MPQGWRPIKEDRASGEGPARSPSEADDPPITQATPSPDSGAGGDPSEESSAPHKTEFMTREPGSASSLVENPYETAVPTPLADSQPAVPGREVIVVEPGRMVFGKYLVLERLGKGGMGEVWLVLDTELDVRRALKTITQASAFHSEARKRFRREARAMAKFTHHNVVTVHDSRLDQRDVAYIVMEYVPGKSLEKILKPGQPMPIDWTLRVLGQLCDALQEAHAQGIIHRDLKPSNLILVESSSRPDQLKVLDFGIAKIRQAEEHPQDAQTIDGAFMGTPPYASPEQIEGRAEPASDLYSIGVMLYEFLTGVRPFHGVPPVLMANTLIVPPPCFHDANPDVQVPLEVERVIMRCLAKKPEDRPQSPQALLEEFEAAVAFSRPQVLPGKAARLPRNRWKLAIPVVLVVALASVVLAIAFARKGGGGGGGGSGGGGATSTSPDPHIEVDGRSFSLWTFGKAEVYLPDGYSVADPSKLAEGGWPKELVREDGVRFVRLNGGTFQMGAREGSQSATELNRPAHQVTLPGFYIQKHEVTNQEILSYRQANASRIKDGSVLDAWEEAYNKVKAKQGEAMAAKHPATNIPWRFAAAFAQQHQGRLPLEAQFEYAAESGEFATSDFTDFVWSEVDDKKFEANELANLDSTNNDFGTVAVGTYLHDCTRQKVFDLIGNVREWCRDPYQPYTKDPLVIPFTVAESNPSNETMMIVRGGSYNQRIDSRYTTYRDRGRGLRLSAEVPNDVGFRLIIECPESPADTQTARPLP